MDVETATLLVAGISVVIGVINSILSSRRAEKNDQQMLETRQEQLFAQIYDWWRSREGIKAYRNVRYKLEPILRSMTFADFFQEYIVGEDEEIYADQMTLAS